MRVTIISGSPRQGSNSLKTSRYVETFFERRHRHVTARVLDLATVELSGWNVASTEDSRATWKEWRTELAASDAYVIVVPEWDGMAPPALRSVFHLCVDGGELAHKPAFLIGVSSGIGGSYPLMELRLSSFKNTQLCYIPEQVVVRRAAEVLNDPETPSSAEDEQLRTRLHHGLDVLLLYAGALARARTESRIEWRRFPYGM